MLDKLLDKVFDFAVSPRGIVTLLSALGGAADRRRETPPTGGGVAYGMAGPRRLQQVRDLGRYSDVVRFDEGGPTIALDSPLLYGLTQGPYGPLLAYDIGPKAGPRFLAPDTPQETAPTQGYVTVQEGSGTGPGLGMGMSPQQEAALDAAIASGAHGRSMAALNQTLTDLVNKSTLMTATRGLADFLSPLTAQLTGQAGGLSGSDPTAMAQAGATDASSGVDALGLGPIAASMAAANAAQAINQGVDPATAVQNAVNAAMAQAEAQDIAAMNAVAGIGGDVGGISTDSTGPAAGDSGTGVDAGDGFGVYAQGGSVFTMQDGGFVMTKDAVKGAGGPQGIAQLLPQARMIGGPPDPTGKRDLTPAKIVGPNGVTPARVSRGEAYLPPEGVPEAGGAKALYALMHKLERNA